MELFITIALLIYFAPTCISFHRSHPQLKAIFAANLLLGWTFIGWGAIVVWSLINHKNA